MIAERINKIGLSPTMKIAGRAKKMIAEGIDVVDFSVGEPDFPTPLNIKKAAKKALDLNYTRYTMNDGLIELRKAISKKLLDDNGLDYNVNEIIVTNGAKQAIFNSVLAVVNEGEEVIIPAPYWVSYPEMVHLAKGKPVIIQTKEENGFKLTAEELRNAITINTKAFILCNPSNPTGAAYSEKDLFELVSVLEKEEIVIIADEIYEKLVYNDFKFRSVASLSNAIKAKTIVVNGFSKAYSMTGWRLGYAAGPRKLIEACSKIQSHCTSNASSISQYAAIEALSGSQAEVIRMLGEFQKRRDFIVNKLNSIPGITCHNPEGAFYVFPNISSYFGKEHNGLQIRNSYGFAYYILNEAKVAVVPGDPFGAEGYVRLSYSTSMDKIEEGMRRIEEALAKLETPAKARFIEFNNTITRVKKAVAPESSISIDLRNALVAEAESYLNYDNYFEWNASIGNYVIKLKTNVPHLYDFWMENWYPAQLSDNLEADGIIYAIEGVSGRGSHIFYNTDTNTGLMFNTDYYGSLRSLAFSLVTDIAQKKDRVFSIRGMSAVYEGKGFVIMGPKGSRKTEIFYGLLTDDSLAWHSSDLLLIDHQNIKIVAENPERKIYIPTITASIMKELNELFDRSKCENIVVKPEECEMKNCGMSHECRMDIGYPYCYEGSPESYAMLDPYWIGGMHRHVKSMKLNCVFIMKNEPDASLIEKLSKERAVDMLEKGIISRDQSITGNQKHIPFYNSHLIVDSEVKIQTQERFFYDLFEKVDCYAVNLGTASIDEICKGIINCLNNPKEYI